MVSWFYVSIENLFLYWSLQMEFFVRESMEIVFRNNSWKLFFENYFLNLFLKSCFWKCFQIGP